MPFSTKRPEEHSRTGCVWLTVIQPAQTTGACEPLKLAPVHRIRQGLQILRRYAPVCFVVPSRFHVFDLTHVPLREASFIGLLEFPLRNVQKQTQPLDKITSCLGQALVTSCIWFPTCVYEWLHVPALMLSLQPYIYAKKRNEPNINEQWQRKKGNKLPSPWSIVCTAPLHSHRPSFSRRSPRAHCLHVRGIQASASNPSIRPLLR